MGGTLLGRVGGMRHAGRVLGQGFGIAQTHGAGDELQRVHEAQHAVVFLDGVACRAGDFVGGVGLDRRDRIVVRAVLRAAAQLREVRA